MNKTTGVKPPEGSEPNPLRNSSKTTVHKKKHALSTYFWPYSAFLPSRCRMYVHMLATFNMDVGRYKRLDQSAFVDAM